jgi:polyisoprenoid-binding protein YceI
MIRFLLYALAACALLGFGAGATLLATPDKLSLVVDAGGAAEREAPPPPPPDRTDEVLAEVGALRQALAAFAQSLDASGAERDALRAELAAERRDAGRARAALAEGLARLERQGQEVRAHVDAMSAAVAAAAQVRPEPAAAPRPAAPVHVQPALPAEPAVREETPEAAPAPPPAPKRKSLAALLAERPRHDVRDAVTMWKLVAGHCRVGFDGTSTIHNFTARSDAVEGSFRLRFKDPRDGAAGEIRVRVATLDSDNDGRDEEIHRQLAGERGKAPEITCEILSITAAPGQEGDKRAARARVRFGIRGQTHEVDVPLSLEFTARRLLHIQGEATLNMSDYGIHPKAKLGLIKVEDAVTAWWDLYAEVDRANG